MLWHTLSLARFYTGRNWADIFSASFNTSSILSFIKTDIRHIMCLDGLGQIFFSASFNASSILSFIKTDIRHIMCLDGLGQIFFSASFNASGWTICFSASFECRSQPRSNSLLATTCAYRVMEIAFQSLRIWQTLETMTLLQNQNN